MLQSGSGHGCSFIEVAMSTNWHHRNLIIRNQKLQQIVVENENREGFLNKFSIKTEALLNGGKIDAICREMFSFTFIVR